MMQYKAVPHVILYQKMRGKKINSKKPCTTTARAATGSTTRKPIQKMCRSPVPNVILKNKKIINLGKEVLPIKNI